MVIALIAFIRLWWLAVERPAREMANDGAPSVIEVVPQSWPADAGER